jgi:drug/metabolite transporter (DMT)-like permease
VSSDQGRPVPVLALAVTAISAAAVLVRLAPDVSPVAAALWRTAAVGLLLSPTLLRTKLTLQRRDPPLILLSGLLLALHFWSWFASLAHTSVMRSTVLVCLTPIWAGLLEWGLLKHAPHRQYWVGVGLAVLGVVVMSGSGPAASSLLGDGLALLGGVLSASYLLVGRVVRPRVPIGPYGSLICLSCAAWLLPAAWLTGAPLTGFATTSWLALLGMALGPQLIGHIGLNYAVRYVPAATVAALLLLEPVGASILGAVLLAEIPSPREILGGLLILVGVGASSWRR